MRKTNEIISVVLVLFLAVSLLSFPVGAGDTLSFSLRIEGKSDCLFYGTVTVSDEADGVSLQSALITFDEENEDIDIFGEENNYISSVNGENAGYYGGWDGWLFRINGADAVSGISDIILNENDEIVLYYGDPFGTAGMQYPVVYAGELFRGVLYVKSTDVTYDASYNPIYTENPVVGATLVWGYGDNESAEYVTDSDGAVTISADKLTLGAHSLSLSRYAQNGCPTLLKLKPDYEIIASDGVFDVEPEEFLVKNGVLKLRRAIDTETLNSMLCEGIIIQNADGSTADISGNALSATEMTLNIPTGDANGVLTLAISGDVDGNGIITTDDARTVLRSTVGLEELSAAQCFAADTVDTPEIITTDDARFILRSTVGLEII